MIGETGFIALAALLVASPGWPDDDGIRDFLKKARDDSTVPDVRAGRSVGELNIGPLTGCDENMAAKFHAAATAALEKVGSCLSKLKAEWRDEILAYHKGGLYRYQCQELAGRNEGVTEHKPDGTVVISIDPKGGSYPLVQRIFHELLHSADPRGLGQNSRHAKPGNADAIWGCHMACFSPGMTEMDELMRNEVRVPLHPSYPECSGGNVCASRREYAFLCARGKPLLSKAQLEKRLPECVLDQALNNCEAEACGKLRKLVEQGEDISEFGERVGAAILGDESRLRQQDKPLFKALKETAPQACLAL